VPRLILGPLLRYVGETEATVWVETDRPCEVAVLGCRAGTFHVAGHHYAIVHVEGLEPGTVTQYAVALDGEPAWPEPGDPFPAPSIRTLAHRDPLRILFGSCRVSLPHEPPFTFSHDEDAWGFERDALEAYARRMLGEPRERWPHLMLFCGDQVYADELSPQLTAFVRGRRGAGHGGPGDQAGDFEEYTRLYRDAWGDPITRWFLSVVSSAMIWDDHDVHDDWNTSQVWVEAMRRQPWWETKMAGAVVSYWIYQHAGNLAPRELHADPVWRGLGGRDDWDALARFAVAADRSVDGTQWSYCRDVGPVRLVVMDSRGGRVLTPGARRMVDDEEWDFIVRHAIGDVDHLLLGTSLPFLLARSMHDLEAWNEAVCDGAWGGLAARAGERIRQGLDLEHWAAFRASFEELAGLLRAVATGQHGGPPATIVGLSGDVHHAYLAEVGFPAGTGARSAVYQAVCSPVRNPLAHRARRAIRLAHTRPARWVGDALARAAGVPPPRIRWRDLAGPFFDNQIAALDFDGRCATLRLERAVGELDGPARLECVAERRLDRAPASGAAGGPATPPPARALAAPR
jgi:hypothetical protein